MIQQLGFTLLLIVSVCLALGVIADRENKRVEREWKHFYDAVSRGWLDDLEDK